MLLVYVMFVLFGVKLYVYIVSGWNNFYVFFLFIVIYVGE